MDFKLNQKVRVKVVGDNFPLPVNQGKEGVVRALTSDYTEFPFLVEFADGGASYYAPSELEAVVE